ncbi:MAG: hypothetical protein JSS84_13045 [Bacteroidetes bacterium]|nr:hypothetical protein [Bacteroidota bacterium]
MGRIFTRGNVLYVLFLLLILILAAELGARWYLSNVLQKSTERKFQFDSYRLYGHVPGFQEKDEKGVRLSINRQGFRRTSDLAIPKPAGTYRIFLMGASAAHGISSANPFPVGHVRDNETIDAHLEKLLGPRFPDRKVEVVNAAVTGYKVYQHTIYLLSEILRLEPDMIVFMDGYNDHYAFGPSENEYTDNTYDFWGPRLRDPSLSGGLDYMALWASDFSGLARGFYAWRNNRDAYTRDLINAKGLYDWSDDRIRQGYLSVRVKRYLGAIGNNLALLHEHGVRAVVSLQPGLAFRDTAMMAPVERDVLLRIVHDHVRKVLQPLVLADLDSITRQYRVPFIDLNPAMSASGLSGQQLFLDYCHLTPIGSQATAEALLPVIEQAMRDTVPQEPQPTMPLNHGTDP